MSANKRKGDAFERDVVRVLRAHGYDVERTLRLGAHDDRGDITGIRGMFLDCKDRGRFSLAEWCDEIRAEAEVCGLLPALVVKRRGYKAERAYVVCDLLTFAQLVEGR